MDGARFANAIASLGVKPKDITWKAGVDVLCFGGTKNGIAVGVAVVFFNSDLAKEFDYRCKQSGQLASNMRFLAAPWLGMLQNNAWLARARHANEMAALLEKEVEQMPQAQKLFPREANAVFVQLPEMVIEGMYKRGWMFYNFIGKGGCRLMCSWDTQEEDVQKFAKDLKELFAKQPALPSAS